MSEQSRRRTAPAIIENVTAAAIRRMKDPKGDETNAIALCYEYKRQYGTPTAPILLEELFRRHARLMHKLAWNMARTIPEFGTEEDMFAEAHIGAEKGYRTFSTTGGSMLSTWTYNKGRLYIMDEADKQGIACPSHSRALRSFLQGKYDAEPAKKADQAKKLKLETNDLLSSSQQRNRLLVNRPLSLDAFPPPAGLQSSVADLIVDPRGLDQNTLAKYAEGRRRLESLDDMERQVYQLVLRDEMGEREAAIALDVSYGKLRTVKRAIYAKIRSWTCADAADAKQLGV